MKSSVGKQIYKRIMIFVLLTLVTIFAVSKLLDFISYNPESYTMVSEEEDYKVSDFTMLFDNYLSLYYPGTILLDSKASPKKGFGCYEYRYNISKRKWHTVIGNNYNTILKIKRGKLSPEFLEDGTMVILADSFYDAGGDQEYYAHVKENLTIDDALLSDIRKLPDSAELICDISFDETKTAKEFASFMKNYDCHYIWAAVSNPYAYMMGTVTGLNLSPTVVYSVTDDFAGKYPGITDFADTDWSEDAIANNLTDHYLSSLKLMLDHKAFVKTVNTSLIYIKEEQLQSQYELVSEKGLPIIGSQIRVSKEELLRMIEEKAFSYLYVEDVTVSPLAW